MRVQIYDWLRRTGGGANVPFDNPIRFYEYISFRLRYEDGVDGRDNIWLTSSTSSSWDKKYRSQYGVISNNKVNRYKLGTQYSQEYQTDSIVTDIKQGIGYRNYS